MLQQEITKIDQSGLRYESKANGSLFGTSIGLTMSCIKCGNHRPRSLLLPVRLAGALHYKCKENCGKSIAAVSAEERRD